MLSLILAIVSSALVSILLRAGETRIKSNMGMLLCNYITCTLLGGFFALRGRIPAAGDGRGFALALGIFGGFLFLYSLVVYQKSIARNGVVLSSTFMKLGVMVPTLAAMVFFGEKPNLLQIAGFLLALTAIVMMHFTPGKTERADGRGLLILLLLVCGGADALTNVYDKIGNPDGKDLFLLAVFLTALALSAGPVLRRREKIGKWELLCGIGMGIPNYFSSRFLLAALKTVPAVAVFPVYSTGTILLVTLTGMLLFRERLTRRKTMALLLILTALVLLNL